MKESIIRGINREALCAYNTGKMEFMAYGVKFFLEKVADGCCRVITTDDMDAGIRIENGVVYCG